MPNFKCLTSNLCQLLLCFHFMHIPLQLGSAVSKPINGGWLGSFTAFKQYFNHLGMMGVAIKGSMQRRDCLGSDKTNNNTH